MVMCALITTRQIGLICVAPWMGRRSWWPTIKATRADSGLQAWSGSRPRQACR